jgi:hypothetical protein
VDSVFLVVLPLAVLMLWYEMYSVRQKVRELQTTVTDANTLKREQEMLLANAFRRGGTYVLACVVSVSFLLMHFGFITDRTGVGLIWAWVLVTIRYDLLVWRQRCTRLALALTGSGAGGVAMSNRYLLCCPGHLKLDGDVAVLITGT